MSIGEYVVFFCLFWCGNIFLLNVLGDLWWISAPLDFFFEQRFFSEDLNSETLDWIWTGLVRDILLWKLPDGESSKVACVWGGFSWFPFN